MQTEIRVAISADGREFRDTGRVFACQASTPDLVMLRDGGLLALIDRVDRRTGQIQMVVSASPSDGKRWTAPRPIKVLNEHDEIVAARRGAWFRTRSGNLGLVFVASESHREAAKDEADRVWVVWCAFTADGLIYRVPARTMPITRGRGHLHPMAITVEGRTHVYVMNASGDCDSPARRSAYAEHFVSDDGLSFEKLGVAHFPGALGGGSVIAREDRLAAFASGKEGVICLRTDDAHHWRAEPRTRLAGGWDPAVVRLSDRSYLMFFCAHVPDEAKDVPQLVPPNLADLPLEEDWQISMPPADGQLADAPSVSGGAIPLGETRIESGGVARTADAASDTLDDPVAVMDSEDGQDRPSEFDGVSHDEVVALSSSVPEEEPSILPEAPPADWDDRAGFGFVDEPDFETRVDYLSWYRDLAVGQPVENAYEAYAWFMPTPWAPPPSGTPFPELRNMFSDQSSQGPPAPWDAAQHPEWEESRNASQHIMAQFREATRHGSYAMPPLFNDQEEVEGPPIEEPLLFRMILPQLHFHLKLARSAVANAWRKDGGGDVSPARMLDAFETALRGANHIDEGMTLIEDLVAAAERRLVQKNALWALKRGVLKGADLDRVLDTLERFDRNDDDPIRYLRGEHAAVMDAVQYIYGPPAVGRGPRLNPHRLQHVLGAIDPELRVERLDDLTDEDAVPTVKALTAYYQELANLMRVGYPLYRRADISGVARRYQQLSPLVALLVADLGRVHQNRARGEASRRATQLTIAIHRWSERRGRYPSTLTELPEACRGWMSTDPFSGQPFRYGVDSDGFTLYSVGENGIDDGGVNLPDGTDATADQPYDFVYWPPSEN